MNYITSSPALSALFILFFLLFHVWIVFIFIRDKNRLKKEFEDPNTFSQQDASRLFTIKKIKDGKILIREMIQDKDHNNDLCELVTKGQCHWYYANMLDNKLLQVTNRESGFIVIQNEDKIVFQKWECRWDTEHGWKVDLSLV